MIVCVVAFVIFSFAGAFCFFYANKRNDINLILGGVLAYIFAFIFILQYQIFYFQQKLESKVAEIHEILQ